MYSAELNKYLFYAGLLAIFPACKQAQKTERPPNILLIVSEDNAPDLGCYGNMSVHTPNLDRLASEGVRFTHAYATYSVSSPSRSTIFTGLYPHQNGQIGLATHAYSMYDSIRTLPAYLHKAGYRTGCIGKIHVNPESGIPFDYWENRGANFEKKDLPSYAGKAARFASQSEQPYFLMVNFPDAHYPFQAKVENMPEQQVDPETVTPLPYLRIPSGRHIDYLTRYYDCINRLDESVGMLLDSLKQAGALDNTVIIYLSDHGPQFPRAKYSNYEPALQVPFLVKWPQHIKAGSVNGAFISTVDLLPTFIGLAGGVIPPCMPGKNLVPLLQGEVTELHWHIFAGGMGSAPFMHYPRRSVRDDRYKLIVNYNSPAENPHYELSRSQVGHFAPGLSDAEMALADDTIKTVLATWKNPPRYELYDLLADPLEFDNLSGRPEYKEKLDQLIAVLQQWQEDTCDPVRKPELLGKINREMEEAISNHTDYFAKGFRWGYLDYFKQEPHTE